MNMNLPSPRLAILRAQLAAEAESTRRRRANYKLSNEVGCSCHVPAPNAADLPLPPSYDEDLLEWLLELQARKDALVPQKKALVHKWLHGEFTVNNAAQGDAYVSAKRPEPAADVWHSEAPAKGLRHMVCVRSSIGAPVGRVYDKQTHQLALEMIASNARVGSDYRLCDSEGWIPHVPTADSGCPVPQGVEFSVKLYDGQTSPGGHGGCTMIKWNSGTSVVAWHPTGSAA